MSIKANLIREYCKDNGITKEIDFLKDVLIFNDMKNGVSNPYIKEWNLDIKKPTTKELETYETSAQKEENDNNIRATRRNLYGDIGDQLDEIYKDIDAWKARIKKIKEDNPKE